MKKEKVHCVVCKITALMIMLLLSVNVSLSANAAYENNHVNTGNQREDIIAVAETQIGYREGSNNDTKYNRWNGIISGYPEGGYGYPWCHSFVSWCANQAGISTSIIPRTAGTATGRAFFVRQGTYKQSAANGGNYIPQRGDIIYYGSGSSPSHVGIVTGCSGSIISTIEGNYTDKVGRRSISISDSYIIGYGVPKYSGDNHDKPHWAKVTVPKKCFKVGEEVMFTLTSDTGSCYTVGIDNNNGKRLITYDTGVKLDTTTQYYKHTFDKAGDYSCYITTYNDLGLADSERIYFTIYDTKPKWAKVTVPKKCFKVGEEVMFTLTSDTGSCYTVGIDNNNGKRLITYDTGVKLDTTTQYYKHTFDKAGDYSCYITTYNDLGLADSERIYFTIESIENTTTSSTTKKPTTVSTSTTAKKPTITTTSTTTKISTTITEESIFSVSEAKIYIKVGGKYSIEANQTDLTFKSSNEDIAVVSDKGIITGISKGAVVITAINQSKDTASIIVNVVEPKYGDANCDKTIDVSDAVMIMQSLANPSKFKLTDQGRINADCYNVGDGVTNADALAIQKYKLSLITSLPEKK